MNIFLLQLRYNIRLLINNICKKYNLNKKDLLSEFLPTKLPEYIQKNIQENSQIMLENINYSLFTDKKDHKYIIINSETIKMNNIYEAIKL